MLFFYATNESQMTNIGWVWESGLINIYGTVTSVDLFRVCTGSQTVYATEFQDMLLKLQTQQFKFPA